MTCAYVVHKLGVCHKKQQLNNIFNSLKKKVWARPGMELSMNPRRLHDKKRVLKSHYYPANI